MDHLGHLYIEAATDVSYSCLHDPPHMANLVDKLQTIVDKSTVPRKNFLIDTTTNRGDAVVAESSAMKNGIGWVTLQVTEGIHHGVHEWCLRIEDQGETTDGSGLMVGLVPKNFTKYDSFISQGGGWCLSRAGKFYGHWRRQDSETDNVTFGTGDRVIFLLDYDAAKLVVRVGNKQASGHVSNLTQEVFPAVSLHYRHQHVRFEYHLVHERNEKVQNWVDRMALPCAPSYLPLSWEQLERVGLDSYLYSPIFAENLAQLHLQRIRRSSLIRLGLERDSFAGSTDSGVDGGAVQHRYASCEGIAARLTVLRNAFVALHKQAKLGPLAAPFLAPTVTPAYLRHTVLSAAQNARARLSAGGRAVHGGAGGYDAAMECGGVLLIHLFVAAARTPSAVADPLVLSLLAYLLSQSLLALREPSDFPDEDAAPPVTSLTPSTLQLAADNVADVAEAEMTQPAVVVAARASPRLSGLLSLLMVLSVQRGKVSELLRSCRLLLKAPPTSTITESTTQWLSKHTTRRTACDDGSVATSLWPQPVLFDVQRALVTASTRASTLAIPTRLESNAPILSVGYGGGGMVYVHTRDHLSKWGQYQAAQLVTLESTREPAELCAGASQSSLAVTTHAVFLMTDRMRASGTAVVEYNLSLQVRRCISMETAGALWAANVSSTPLLIATAAHDTIVLLRRKARVKAVVTSQKRDSQPAASSTSASATSAALELVIYPSSTFPLKPLRRVALTGPDPAVTASLSHCLALSKTGFVDLGSPLILQGTSGHVTVELLVQLPERTATATTFYRHGDKSSCGEVFVETAVLDGARCVRGGYRHDTRGACVVFAPLSPLSDTQFLHITLVFDGKWNLYFDGARVAANTQGPHVSLDTPKLSWCLGEECACVLAGFRVWRTGRSATEVARDYARLLSGTEPGLVRQLLFCEGDGNVVFNYSQVNTSGEAIHLPPEAMAPRHGVCVGEFHHLAWPPSQHLWSTTCAEAGIAAPPPPKCSCLHQWDDPSHVFVVPSGHIALSSVIAEDADTVAPYAQPTGIALTFYDAQSGEAKPCVTMVPPKLMPRGLVASDPHGRVFSMVEAAADARARMDAVPGGDAGTKQTVLAVAMLPFAERSELPCDTATVSQQSPPVSANLQLNIYDASSSSSSTVTKSEDTTTQPGKTNPETKNASLTCAEAAQCLLRVVGAHAALPIGIARAHLYSPFREDVCKETIHEVVALLGEYVRVVKGSNARRTISLKDDNGPLVVRTVLRVLCRLLRSAKVYRLHPSVLDLQMTADDEHAVLQELVPPLGANEPAQTRLDANVPTVRRLLSVLANLLNDGASVLPTDVLQAAAEALREGVDLIFASVDLRASVLKRALETEGPAGPTPSAMDVVKQALERSFASIPTASALLSVTPPSKDEAGAPFSSTPTRRRVSLSLTELLEAQQRKLQRVQDLLDAILTASLREMRACIAGATTTAPPTAAMNANETVATTAQRNELAALSTIFSTLQILLLGTCITPGTPRRGKDGTTTTTTTATTSTADTSNAGGDGEADYASVTVPFAIHEETEVHHHDALKTYYASLFQAARDGLQCLLRERQKTTPSTTTTTTTAAPVLLVTSRSQSLSVVHASPLGSQGRLAEMEADPDDGSEFASGMGRSRRRSLSDPLVNTAEMSFLATPLHNALCALPYALTARNAAWFLSELQTLVPLTESIRQLCYSGVSGHGVWDRIPYSGAFAAVHDATVVAISWTAVFLATVTQHRVDAAAPTTAGDASPTSSDDAQWLTSSPFLAHGMHLDDGDKRGTAPAKSPVVRTRRQEEALALQRSQKERCVALQRTQDALGKTTPDALVDVLTRAAVTMLYVSNTHALARLSEAWLTTQLTRLFRRLAPLRNALLPRFREGGKSTALAAAAAAEELTARCDFLLAAAHASESDVLRDPLYQTLLTCGWSRPGSASAASTAADARLSAPRRRWRRAIAQVRERLALRRAVSGGAEALTLAQAISMVTRVLLSEELTAEKLGQLHTRAAQLATLRRAGLKALQQLLVRVPSSVECVALLMQSSNVSDRHGGRGGCGGDGGVVGTAINATVPSRALRGVHDDCGVRLAPVALRAELTSIVHAVMLRIHLAELATTQDERQLGLVLETATPVELHRCPTSVLCDALQFGWEPRDLTFLRLSGAVADVFARHGSLFVSAALLHPDTTWLSSVGAGTATTGKTATSAAAAAGESEEDAWWACRAASEQAHKEKPKQSPVLRDESTTERRHRDKAALYASSRGAVAVGGEAGQNQPALSIDDDEELAEGSTLVTTRELNTRRVWHCIRYLGLSCCRALSRADLPPADQLCCVHFMTGLLQMLCEELEKCNQCASGTTGGGSASSLPFLPAVVERVEAQTRLVCSVVSLFAGALPATPVLGDNSVLRELSVACAKTAHELLKSAQESTTQASIHEAYFRTATALISRCHPASCDAFFATVVRPDLIADDGEPETGKTQAPLPAGSMTLLCLVRCGADALETGSLDGVAAHAVEGLRVVLASAPWMRHLGSPAAMATLEHLLARYTKALGKGATHTARGGASSSSSSNSSMRIRLAILVSLSGLGGCLLHTPRRGLPCTVYSAGSATPGVPSNAFPLSGYVVGVSSTEPAGSKENGKDKAAPSRQVLSVQVVGAAPTVEELSLSRDDVFIATGNPESTMPMGESDGSSVSPCLAWARDDKVAAVIIQSFLAPVLAVLEYLLSGVNERAAAVSSTDVACLAALLDLVRQLAVSPRVCRVLAAQGILHAVNRLATSMVLRAPLRRAELQEFAATAWNYALLNRPRSSPTASPRTVTAASTGTSENRKASPSDTSSSSGQLPPATGASFMANLLRVRAQVVNPMSSDLSAASVRSVVPLQRAQWVVSPPPALAGRAGAATGPDAARHLRAGAVDMLCFYAHPQQRISGALTVTGGEVGNGPALGSLCSEGFTVELAILLCHYRFVPLGEVSSVQSAWTPPPIEFDLLTIQGATETTTTTVRVHIGSGQLHCTVSPDGTTTTTTTGAESAAAQAARSCSLPLTKGDYDDFLHIALFVEPCGIITLVKGGVTANLTLPSGSVAARRVQALVQEKGGVSDIVVGRTGSDATLDAIPLDATTVLLSGLRVSSGTTLRASVKAFADLVRRDRKLPMLEPRDEPCAFTFEAGSGQTVRSTSGQYEATLSGVVQWTPLCYDALSPLKERRETLYVGCNSAPRRCAADGTAASAPAAPTVPRQMLEDFIATMRPAQMESFAFDLVWSVCVHRSREALVAALTTCTRPSYAVESGAAPDASPATDIFRILDKRQLLSQLFNLLAYQHTAELPVADVRLVQDLIAHVLRTSGESIMSSAERVALMQDMAASLLTHLSDMQDQLTLYVPLGTPPTPPASQTAPKDVSVVVPLAVLRSDLGVTLSFEAGKPRQMEQVLVYRDAALTSVVASYPDANGGWGGAELPADAPYVYLRFIRTAPANPATTAEDAASVPLTLSIKSLRPVMARAAFSALCAALRSNTTTTTTTKATSTAKEEAGEWPLFCGRLVSTLAAHSICEQQPFVDQTTHIAAVLAELLQTWSFLPLAARHARAPLHILLAPINSLLMTRLRAQREVSVPETMRSQSLGTYNAYYQELHGVLAAAMHLEAVWHGLSVERVIQARWQRTIKLWDDSTQVTASDQQVQMQYTYPSEGGVRGCVAPPTAIKLPSGEWGLMLDKGRRSLLCRVSTGCTAGVFYWEVTVPSEIHLCREFAVGFVSGDFEAAQNAVPEDVLGADARSWSFSGVRSCRVHNGVSKDFMVRSRWKCGDTIGVSLDLQQRSLSCTVNGQSLGAFDRMDIPVPVPTSGGALFPFIAMSLTAESQGERPVQCRVNLGRTQFLYPPYTEHLAIDPLHYNNPSLCRVWLLALTAQWARQSHDPRRATATGERTLPAVAQRCLNAMAARMRIQCAGRSGPLWVRLMSTRRGVTGDPAISAPDDTPCNLVSWEDAAQGFVRGTVSVTGGKWYYEVTVWAGMETGLSVGWTTTTYRNDGSTVLGEDDNSWVLEGKRMVAKHANVQRNVDHTSWTVGDVLGCALDCDAGTIAFSLNGKPLSLMDVPNPQDATRTCDRTAIFANVCDGMLRKPSGGGLTPAVYMRGKSVVLVRWGSREVQYPPEGYQSLEASAALWSGLVEHVLHADHTSALPPSSTAAPADDGAIERKVALLCASVDINPGSLSAYCLDTSALTTSTMTGESGEATPTPPAASAAERDASDDARIQAVSGIAEVLLPFAHCGVLPLGVDASDAAWALQAHPIRQALALCRPCSLPYVGLQVLQGFLKASNGAVDGVRLTLNRRTALAVARDTSVSVAERVRRSLVGQVHSLLVRREPDMFLTSKKLWSVLFSGEGAEDVGGPYRECLSQMTSELMSTALPFFVPSDNQRSEMGKARDLFIPNSGCNGAFARMIYLFVGRLMGGCLRGGEPLSLFLPSVVWKALLGDAPIAQDLAQMDQATSHALAFVEAQLAKGGEDAATLDEALQSMCPGGFTVADDRGGVHRLIERGDRIPVTSRNASLYTALVREWKLVRQFAPQLDALREGFLEVVPRAAIAYLKWFELEKAVCGQRDYDPDVLLDNAQYDRLAPDDQRVLFLRQVLRDFTAHERALFMRFVSGRERLPQGVQLRIQADANDEDDRSRDLATRRRSERSGRTRTGSTTATSAGATPPRQPSQPQPGTPSPRRAPDRTTGPFSEDPRSPASEPQRLPHASTCFFILTLPRYSSQEIMHDKLLFAIEQCIDMDADFRVRDGVGAEQADGPVLAQVESDDDVFEDFAHLQ